MVKRLARRPCRKCGKAVPNSWNKYCSHACGVSDPNRWTAAGREGLRNAKLGDRNPSKRPEVIQKIRENRHMPTGPAHHNYKGEWLSVPKVGLPRMYVHITPEEVVEFGVKKPYVARYRYVWNRTHPDDPLKPGEHIHHVNGDSLDDRPENLQKMTNNEHVHEHMIRPRKPLSEAHRELIRKRNTGVPWNEKRRASYEASKAAKPS